ncbi:hypothetical protein EVAR_10925_1 [Eumeta japonica]|uniref:Uncharacterized protein n=1 Tax=Eumeta variegata TaxID=151549 RepID=A0A4C1U642_EUMVA|nr:hypothetical protein EVAR_10925_1 [Eumeta japonica]
MYRAGHEFLGDGAAMRLRGVALALAVLALAALAAGEARGPTNNAVSHPARRWQRGQPRTDHRTPRHFVGSGVASSSDQQHEMMSTRSKHLNN